jgi:hypothetical protein
MLDFLGIGAQKAGTTWAYNWLGKHPGITFPLGKEVHFWNRPSLDDLPWYWEHMRTTRCPVSPREKTRLGEITPAYALLAAERVRIIHSLFPQLRIFFIIRNPIDRAWSAALMALKRAELSLEEASDQWFIDHFHSAGSLARGDYGRTLDTWLSVFPTDQLLVLYHDHLLDEPREALRGLALHLGVDPAFYAQFTDDQLGDRVAPTASESSSQFEIRPQLRRVLTELYNGRLRALSERISIPEEWDRDWLPRDRLPQRSNAQASANSSPRRRAPSLTTTSIRLAVFVAVLNRGDLALASLNSLRRALRGFAADIYLFDNGSAPETASKLRLFDPGPPHRLTVVRLPENRGLPCAFNLFCRLLEEPCDFSAYAPPDVVMLADADVFYKRPLSHLVSVLVSDETIGAVSGHDSSEHPALGVAEVCLSSSPLALSEKLIERGQCLFLRRADILDCYPLPHHTNLDLDWQLLMRHPTSISAKGKRIVAIDATLHLGVFNSTWSRDALPATAEQLREVDVALERLGLAAYAKPASPDQYGAPNGPGAFSTATQAQSMAREKRRQRDRDYVALKPRQLLVLGMHRSGTSVVTGLLERLGAHVGASHDLLAKDLANPAGYFERRDVLHLNQQLLARYAADAYQIGHLPVGGADRFEEHDLAARASAIIARLDAHAPWVAKDPRFCITLPFWRRAGLNALAAIIVVRDPSEVARSLQRRDRLTLPYALALWERYYIEALQNTAGLPRVLVDYNRLMQDATTTLENLVRSLMRIGVRMPGALTGALLHLDTRLYRNRRPRNVPEAGPPPTAQAQLYSRLTQARFDDPNGSYRMSETSAAILRDYPVTCDLTEIEDAIRL